MHEKFQHCWLPSDSACPSYLAYHLDFVVVVHWNSLGRQWEHVWSHSLDILVWQDATLHPCVQLHHNISSTFELKFFLPHCLVCLCPQLQHTQLFYALLVAIAWTLCPAVLLCDRHITAKCPISRHLLHALPYAECSLSPWKLPQKVRALFVVPDLPESCSFICTTNFSLWIGVFEWSVPNTFCASEPITVMKLATCTYGSFFHCLIAVAYHS